MNDAEQPQSHAEQTDPTTLGETVGQADRSGDVFPPERPLGVEDPSILADGRIARDDVETRAGREWPEPGDPTNGPDPDIGHDLLDPSDDPDRLDDEAQLVARRGDDSDTAAEITAVHEIPGDQLR